MAGTPRSRSCRLPLQCGLLATLSFPSLALGAGDSRPRYARVDGDIETVWQRPAVEPKGLFFIAHGCQHQATDIFPEVAADGWRFAECASSNLGRCLGLPEEVRLQEAARARGYIVMAVSGGDGVKSCWDLYEDSERVAAAVRYVLAEEHLPPDAPILATGASSGGFFMGRLVSPLSQGGLPNLRCIVPQIMGLGMGQHRGVPTMFVHMPRDSYTAATVREQIQQLDAQGVRTAEFRVKPVPITEDFLARCVGNELGRNALAAMQSEGLLDSEGYLMEEPRKRRWVEPVRAALSGRSSDTFDPDESCLAELMNVAWAQHEFTSQYAKEMLDFCEETGAYGPRPPPRGRGLSEAPGPELF